MLNKFPARCGWQCYEQHELCAQRALQRVCPSICRGYTTSVGHHRHHHHHHHDKYGRIIVAKLFTDVARVPALDCLIATPSTSTCASSNGNQHELLASIKTAASVERSNMIRERKILHFGHFGKTIIQSIVVCL